MAGKIMSMKNSSDTIGDQPATLRFVAQCLDQLLHRVLAFDLSTRVPNEQV